MTNTWYLLLYLPLTGILVLWLLAGIKLVKNFRQYSRKRIQDTVALELSLALFLASYAVMVITHGRSFKAAILLLMAMSTANFFRTTKFYSRKGQNITSVDEQMR